MVSIKNSTHSTANPVRLAIAILAAVFLYTLVQNVSDLLNFSYFHEEQRNLFHFDTSWSNPNDYIGNFLGAAPAPVLYTALTNVALAAGIDIVTFHKIVMLVCAVLFLVGAALAGYRVGDFTGACLCVILVAAQPLYFYQTNSATPHAFAFPVLMWGLVSLLYQRYYVLAIVTILASLLYIPVAIMLGFSLAWALFAHLIDSGFRFKTLISHGVVLVLTGVIALAALWMQLSPMEGYGQPLAPNTMTHVYPENGLGGRLHLSATEPMVYVASKFFGQFHETLSKNITIPILLVYLLSGVAGMLLLARKPEFKIAVVGFLLTNIAFFIFVTIYKPYISYRFIFYPLFTILPICFVMCLLAISIKYFKKPAYQALIIVLTIGLFLAVFDSRNTKLNGFKYQLDSSGHELMKFIGELPESTMLAAWAFGYQTDMIPYVAKRALLVTGKAHYTSYEGYVVQMRERTNDLINAYLATDTAALNQLSCKWKVDYLVVDSTHFTDLENAPNHFLPFSKKLLNIYRKTRPSDMYLNSPSKKGVVFKSGNFSVVDIKVFAEDSAC